MDTPRVSPPVPSTPSPLSRRKPLGPSKKTDRIVSIRPWLVAALTILGASIALRPGLAFAPVPRVVLFLLMALLFALLFAGEIDARFELKLGQLVATGGGVFAAVVILLFVLNHVARGDLQMAQFTIRDSDGQDYLMTQEMVDVRAVGSSDPVRFFTSGPDLFINFSNDVIDVEVSVKKFGQVKWRGHLTYTGNRSRDTRLGKDLPAVQ